MRHDKVFQSVFLRPFGGLFVRAWLVHRLFVNAEGELGQPCGEFHPRPGGRGNGAAGQVGYPQRRNHDSGMVPQAWFQRLVRSRNGILQRGQQCGRRPVGWNISFRCVSAVDVWSRWKTGEVGACAEAGSGGVRTSVNVRALCGSCPRRSPFARGRAASLRSGRILPCGFPARR